MSRIISSEIGFPRRNPDGIKTWNLHAKSQRALTTTAIGKNYTQDFVNYSLPTWKAYAQKHDFAIILFSDGSVPETTFSSLNGAWLKMLVPQLVAENFPQIEQLAVIDTDILINPASPNIFDGFRPGSVGIVSSTRGFDFDLEQTKKRMAFLRRRHYDGSYPLDSVLFASPAQLFEEEGFPPLDDYFCSGVFVVDRASASRFASWFFEARELGAEGALAWEQNFLNHKVLSFADYAWLDSRFQAIWNLEMAAFHPSLYLEPSLEHSVVASRAVADTLNRVFFLHFAGSWPESFAWRNSPHTVLSFMADLWEEDFLNYLASPSTGRAKGKISYSKGAAGLLPKNL